MGHDPMQVGVILSLSQITALINHTADGHTSGVQGARNRLMEARDNAQVECDDCSASFKYTRIVDEFAASDLGGDFLCFDCAIKRAEERVEDLKAQRDHAPII